MRFDFDREKSRETTRKHGVSLKEAFDQKRTADEIAEMASRGEDVSGYFTNKFAVVRPVQFNE